MADLPSAADARAAARKAAERMLRDPVPARRLRTRLALERLEAWGGGRSVRFLDAGCDVGLLSLELARRHPAWTLDGVDLSDEILVQARELAEEEGLGDRITYRQGDITQDLPAATYDAVAALECLTLIPDLDAAVAGLAGT